MHANGVRASVVCMTTEANILFMPIAGKNRPAIRTFFSYSALIAAIRMVLPFSHLNLPCVHRCIVFMRVFYASRSHKQVPYKRMRHSTARGGGVGSGGVWLRLVSFVAWQSKPKCTLYVNDAHNLCINMQDGYYVRIVPAVCVCVSVRTVRTEREQPQYKLHAFRVNRKGYRYNYRWCLARTRRAATGIASSAQGIVVCRRARHRKR